MGLDLWFREDVARILAATHEAMRTVADATALPGDDESAAYRQGFTDALRAVGIAFGVCLPALAKPGAGERAICVNLRRGRLEIAPVGAERRSAPGHPPARTEASTPVDAWP